MSWGPLPSSHLIYKCNVAGLFAKSNPDLNHLFFFFGDHITGTKEAAWSNYQAPKAAAQLLPVLCGDVWTLTFSCPLCFQRPRGRDVSGFNSVGCLKVISCFIWFLAWSLCQFLKLVLEPHPDIQESSLIRQNIRTISLIAPHHRGKCFPSVIHILSCLLMRSLCLVCACHPPERWRQTV